MHRQALRKARFWTIHARSPLNERQKLMLSRCLEGFKGQLTARKWSKIAHRPLLTVERDMRELLELGVLSRDPGDRKKASFSVVVPDEPSL